MTDPARIEQQWARQHPRGEAEQAPNGALALWNFAVGRADLKPEHEAALRSFVGTRILYPAGTAFVVAGFASSTGSETADDALAIRRAEAVARWLDGLGFRDPVVSPNPGTQPIPGDDGRAMARNRRVEVLAYDPYPVKPAPPQAPAFVIDRTTAATSPAPPAVIAPPPPPDDDLPDWLPARLATGFTLPDVEFARVSNQWVKARFRFEGAFRVQGGDRRNRAGLQAMMKEGNRGELAFSYAVSDWLAARFSVEEPNLMSGRQSPRNPAVPEKKDLANGRAGLVATVRDAELGLAGELELSVQFRLDEPVYGSVGVTALLPVEILGTQLTLAVTGKVKVTAGPGPATSRLALRALPAAGYVVGTIVLSVFFIVAYAVGIEEVRQAGIRHAQHISGRDAFAARVAFEVVGASARTELESLMAEWRRFPEPEVIATVERCYNDAGKQVEELRGAGKLDAARVGWAAKYGQPDPSFHGVRMALFLALGGYDAEGPLEFALSGI